MHGAEAQNGPQVPQQDRLGSGPVESGLSVGAFRNPESDPESATVAGKATFNRRTPEPGPASCGGADG